MTHPAWYDEPTNESCRWCGKQFLNRYEVERGLLCIACQNAGAPDACTCPGVAFCEEGIHVRKERITNFQGKAEDVLCVRRVRNRDGAAVLERCPTQAAYYERQRARFVATAVARKEGEKRPIGVR